MKEKLEIICKAIDEKKGEDICIYAFSQLNPAIDEVVIASGANLRIDHMEGNRDSRGILLDAGDIIVHIFEQKERGVYHLEKLYADLPVSRYDV